MTTCKTHSVKSTYDGDRYSTEADTNKCFTNFIDKSCVTTGEGNADGSNLYECTSKVPEPHGTHDNKAASRGIGILSCEPSRSEDTVDVSAYASSNADPKDTTGTEKHSLAPHGVKADGVADRNNLEGCGGVTLLSGETCNRYTNAGIGKESITCESLESAAKVAGPEGEAEPDVSKLDGILRKSTLADKSYSSGRIYKAETEDGA